MKMKHVWIAVLATCLFSASAPAADFALVKDGKAVSRIVVAANAPKPVAYGAEELSRYLKKITGASVPVAGSAVSGSYPVYVTTVSDTVLVRKAGIDPASLKEDGFAISAKKDGLYIIGSNPRGALYGCYEILKKYGSMRWLVPGDDGEYYSPKSTVAVPEQKTVRNPYLKGRIQQCGAESGGEGNGARWLARNYSFSSAATSKWITKKGVPSKQGEVFCKTAMNFEATSGNSHILTFMMHGWSKNSKEVLHKLYLAHPEYFPLIGGKRVELKGAFWAMEPNPCISNPALLDLMAKNLYEYIKGPYGAQGYITIGNNDSTVWCECPNCRKLDVPERANTKGARSDRYWYMVNEIAKRVWKMDPTRKLGGWAYQDFWYPPARVKIDPRLRVMISFNNECWRHTIKDPACSVNAELRKIMDAWKKTNLPVIYNRDEIACGAVAECYLPSAKILYQNFRDYPSLGYSGSTFCVASPFPTFLNYAKNTAPFYGKNLRFYAMWQCCYLSAQFMWDIHQDFEKLYEEANSLYYGKAWQGGFKEFKKLQTKYFLETPGCIGWGLGAPLGRCLDQAGSEAKLRALMDKAIAAAKTDKDPRALQHILRDKEIFEMTWLKERKNYLDNFKELNIYKRTAPIKIDGVLNEADWKNADALSNFKPGGMTPKDTRVEQTFVRVTYDTDHLYIAVECMEPHPEKIVAGADLTANDDPWRILGNNVQLFYNYPDLANQYYHLAINSKGQVISAKQTSPTNRVKFKTNAKYATKILKDRWILEIAIPTSEIGMKCYDGSTWKLNIGRGRKLTGMTRSENSSCSNGFFHGAANYVNIKFTPGRTVGLKQNADPSSWKNADFNTVVPDSSINRHYRYNRGGGWKFENDKQFVPKDWTVSANAAGICKKDGGNYYIRMTKGYISQYFIGEGKGTLKITFRARGKGNSTLWCCSYQNKPKGQNGYLLLQKSECVHAVKLTPQWKSYSFETRKLGVPTERVAIRFNTPQQGVLELDDVYVTFIPNSK